jgi:flavin-dependent dehydrogenase
MSNQKSYDAIIIGGGPGGSTAASVLAGKGRKVVVLERERFPRYHIGESLIPFTYFTLERIGMIERMKASHFTKKYSVAFVSQDGRASQPFYFFKHWEHDAARTWQVQRSEFDLMLLNNARDRSAEVIEEITARELIQSNGAVTGVRAVTKTGKTREFHAPMTIDCTGRDAFASSRNGWKIRDPYLNKIAVWTYYEGAMRDPGVDEGATMVAYVPEKGWFWYIPLARNIVSVGVVAEKDYLYSDGKDLEKIFRREVGRNKWIEDHLAVGKQIGPYRVTAEFSYRSRHCSSDGLVLAGDAFAFLDPVFSSGVCLALYSGEAAGHAVDAALTKRDFSAAHFEEYGRLLCQSIESMRALVYTFYNHEWSFRKFIDKYPDLSADMTDCLMGNLLRDYEPLQTAMATFVELPPYLEYGKPLVASPVGSIAK